MCYSNSTYCAAPRPPCIAASLLTATATACTPTTQTQPLYMRTNAHIHIDTDDCSRATPTLPRSHTPPHLHTHAHAHAHTDAVAHAHTHPLPISRPQPRPRNLDRAPRPGSPHLDSTPSYYLLAPLAFSLPDRSSRLPLSSLPTRHCHLGAGTDPPPISAELIRCLECVLRLLCRVQTQVQGRLQTRPGLTGRGVRTTDRPICALYQVRTSWREIETEQYLLPGPDPTTTTTTTVTTTIPSDQPTSQPYPYQSTSLPAYRPATLILPTSWPANHCHSRARHSWLGP